jgi:hypothetical protein
MRSMKRLKYLYLTIFHNKELYSLYYDRHITQIKNYVIYIV